MVFHVTNYMRETNVWMIRKCRWIFWSIGAAVPIYRNVYWDYLARRTAWRERFSNMTDAEKQAQAESERANWGYRPRYTPVHDFSIKKAIQDEQTPEEEVNDTPRIRLHDKQAARRGLLTATDVSSVIYIAREHNRAPGVFNYDFPQEFYSHYADIPQESVIEIGSDYRKRVHNMKASS